MGLDQFAFSLEHSDSKRVEFAYWRKHPYLHGLMEQIFRERGETGEFNCVPLPLTKNDIERIRNEVKESTLPRTEGFFFGSDSSEEYREADLKFCDEADRLLDEGKIVIYDSWW